MSNLALLLKINGINEFGINKIKTSNKKDKNKIIGIVLLISIGVVALAYYIFTMCFYLSDVLLQVNQMELLLVMGFMGGILFTLFTSLYKASSYLFEAKDFDMLISLPIKESTILASKISMMIISNYLYSLAFIIIPAIVYFIKVDTSVTFFLYLIILFLGAPLIPIVISSIISFLLGNISSKIRHKNLAMVGGSLVLIIIYMVSVMQIESIAKNILENSTSIMNAINKIYPPAYYFVDALKNNNITSLGIYLILSLVPFLIFIAVFSKGFKKINSRMNEKYKVKNFKLDKFNTSKPTIALLKKEISRYLSSYIYVLNTSFGMILLLIGTIGILVFGIDKINELLAMNNIDMNLLKPQIILVFVFVIATTCTTYCSISLEGKSLWILKSSPVEELDIFKAKILMNLLLNLPISVLSFLLIGIKLKFDVAFLAIMVGTIVALCILVSVAGLLINLYFPNLDWKNEVAVVKRSAGIMIILFGTMIYVGAFGLAFIYLKVSNLNIYLMIFTIITLILDIVLWKMIKTNGVKLFRAI